jgi:hypothetical protein
VATLRSMIPTGTAAVAAKPFTPPPPEFRAASASIPPTTENEEESPAPQSGAVATPSPTSNAVPRQYF